MQFSKTSTVLANLWNPDQNSIILKKIFEKQCFNTLNCKFAEGVDILEEMTETGTDFDNQKVYRTFAMQPHFTILLFGNHFCVLNVKKCYNSFKIGTLFAEICKGSSHIPHLFEEGEKTFLTLLCLRTRLFNKKFFNLGTRKTDIFENP